MQCLEISKEYLLQSPGLRTLKPEERISRFSRQVKEAYDDSKQRYGAVKICRSQKGNPYDNACIESFPPVRKKEESYLHTYQDFKESRKAIFESIASWYNRKRIHSAIDSMTPQQKEDEELKKPA